MLTWNSMARVVGSFAVAATAQAQVTQRVSIASDGSQGNGHSYDAIVSAHGRYVAFWSAASNLVAGDTNGQVDVFVHDRLTGDTELVSVATDGTQSNGSSINPSVSDDGHYVAFSSTASNLVPGDTNVETDVFVRDRFAGSTERVSISTDGAQGNGVSTHPSISADGRYVAFVSTSSNLVSVNTLGRSNIFVRDRQAGTTELVSIRSDGGLGNGDSQWAAISADGRYVAFSSEATNLVDGDANNRDDVFIHDRQTGITERVSISTGGVEGDGDSDIPSISADGRYVAFASYSNNFDSSDTNGYVDCFVRDRLMGITERVSISTNGVQGDADSFNAQISGDGRYVAFESRASTLVAGDTNGTYDIFLRDRQSGTAVRVSVATSGAQSAAGSESPSISADGRYVAFDSWASDLVAGDTNGVWDTFVHDIDATGFVSMCDPGVAGVEPCPCLNPATGPGRGCDNSAATGGATFTAAGIAYLSIDTLVFTTSGEMPTALSVVMQGNASIPTGLVYGQGVRCLGGTIIRRLFTKQAVAGSITVPDFGAGDPSVSARSAVKGDVIQPGQSRWYLVYYRDPVVLGGCPASSTFNATQTGQVTWWP